jgi:hypothetical protein
MNSSARLNLNAGIFEVSDWQMADIAEQDLGGRTTRGTLQSEADLSQARSHSPRNVCDSKGLPCELAGPFLDIVSKRDSAAWRRRKTDLALFVRLGKADPYHSVNCFTQWPMTKGTKPTILSVGAI